MFMATATGSAIAEMNTFSEPGTAVRGRFTVRLMSFSVSEFLKSNRKAVLLNMGSPCDSTSSFLTWTSLPTEPLLAVILRSVRPSSSGVMMKVTSVPRPGRTLTRFVRKSSMTRPRSS